MTLVDSHLHVNYNGLSLKDIIRFLDKDRIDYCWLLTWEEMNPGPWFYEHLLVDEVYNAYSEYPRHIIPFYAPDSHRADASLLMEKWFQRAIRGCGELKANLNWDSEPVKSVLQTANKLKIPIVFHNEERGFRGMPYSRAYIEKDPLPKEPIKGEGVI